MTGDRALREEWDRLRTERAALRAQLSGSLDGLSERAHDPFGLKAKFQRHPLLFAGLAAGAGALLVNLLVPRGAPGDERSRAAPREDEGPDLLGSLRDTALRALTPWLTQFLQEHLGDVLAAEEAQQPEPPAE